MEPWGGGGAQVSSGASSPHTRMSGMGRKLAGSCGANLISSLFMDVVFVTAASDGGLHPSEDSWSVGEAQPELLSCLLACLCSSLVGAHQGFSPDPPDAPLW